MADSATKIIKITRANYEKMAVQGQSISKGGITYTYDPTALYLIEDENPRITTSIASTGYVNLDKLDGKTASISYAKNGLIKRTYNNFSSLKSGLDQEFSRLIAILITEDVGDPQEHIDRISIVSWTYREAPRYQGGGSELMLYKPGTSTAMSSSQLNNVFTYTAYYLAY